MTNMENTLTDRKDLKIQALREKISTLVTTYEDAAADYRVEITVLSNQVQTLQQRVNELEAANVQEAQDTDTTDD